MIDDCLHKNPTAKRLILSLLSVPEMADITARECTRWGELFAIDPAAMRVALGRMVKAGLLRASRRGVYRIGPQGASLRAAARGWRSAEARLQPWAGEWLVAHTAHLGRSNRSALRNRERALKLEGMRPLSGGLWLRPANYRETVEETHARMVSLGLEPRALLLRVAELAGIRREDLPALWPREGLEAGYRDYAAAMRNSAARLPAMDLQDAARESFLLGEAVIRLINSDPLLPEEFVDAAARGELIRGMLTYDTLGRTIWERFGQRDEMASYDPDGACAPEPFQR